jgi:hypothetical protein
MSALEEKLRGPKLNREAESVERSCRQVLLVGLYIRIVIDNIFRILLPSSRPAVF